MPRDPRPALDALGVPFVQVVDPNYGYDGAFTPETVFLHWSASSSSSDTAADVVRARHYHSAVARDGTAMLGGWNVRQGHGGEGRQAPISIARAGDMNAADIIAWQNSSIGDDTSSWPNQYGMSVCLDNNGTGETPPAVQYRNWCCTATAFLSTLGLGPGHVIDHAASTNRKIDITGVVPALDPTRWMADIATYLQLLEGGPSAVTQLLDMATTPDGGGYWILTDAGDVYTYGNAKYAGGLGKPDGGRLTNSEPRCITAHPKKGYYIGVADGGVFSFDAPFHGSATEDFPN